MRTRGLIDLQVFTAKFKMLKTQFYKVSLEGLNSRTLLLSSFFCINMVERVTGQKL